MARMLDGITIASQIQKEIQEKIQFLPSRKPCLAVFLVGDHPPSQIYVNRKAKACSHVGILLLRRHFPATVSQEELLQELSVLNSNPAIDGILVQLPLPAHINTAKIIDAINPDKDVDGLNIVNAGKLLIGDPDGFVPCTPLGIKTLLERSGIEVKGKHVVVMGRSNLVGKPTAALLMQDAPGANATVTLVHSFSHQAKQLTKLADILIVAIGKPRAITEEMIKSDAVIIDVGISKIEAPGTANGYQIVGDVDFDRVKDKCAAITPVPGGVGPMTIAMLLSNTWKSYAKSMMHA